MGGGRRLWKVSLWEEVHSPGVQDREERGQVVPLLRGRGQRRQGQRLPWMRSFRVGDGRTPRAYTFSADAIAVENNVWSITNKAVSTLNKKKKKKKKGLGVAPPL